MTFQYGAGTNIAATMASYPCPVCGAEPGVLCTIADSRGQPMTPSLGVMHGERVPEPDNDLDVEQ
ncbi:MAG TPA: hypothetical protein VGG38_12800 [Acidimicrobiales bacterium]|jgi:hypothetical protein